MKDKNIVFITSYPTKGSIFGKGISGLASFAKNTVNSIKHNFNITVLAEFNPAEKDEYIENNVRIKRVWNKNSYFLSFIFLKELLKFKRRDTIIFVEFELATFGDNIPTGLIAIFYLVSRLLGYRVITVMHQVITDLNTLTTHLGLEKGTVKTNITNFLLINLTRYLVRFSNKVIVLDGIHKQKLSTVVGTKNVYVIPHGVETKALSIKPTPHDNINVLFFGHLTWYKGADWLIQSYLDYEKEYPELAKKIFIKLAGGGSPTQKNNPAYIAYYNNLLDLVKSSENIEITGYVNEEDFENIFANSDIQVLPYRVLMSSSGPLSHAFEYEKHVLISNVISPYLDTSDIQTILQSMKLTKSDLVFDLDKPFDLFNRIINLDSPTLDKMKNFSIKVRDERNWGKIGKEYLRVINIEKR